MSIKASIITISNPNEVVADLSARLLSPDGKIKLLPAEEYKSIPPDHLRVWCIRTARYCIPTVELIDWLKKQIDGRSAIEVGAGNADLGYHLGIPSTDSYIQQAPAIVGLYQMTGQVPTNPPPDVRKMDALSAINHFKPQVVIASWLTRKFIKGKDKEGKAEASIYGPEEEKILQRCKTYIHVGNTNVHSQKTILSQPHTIYYMPWLVSRAEFPEKNVIWVWGKKI